jgi:hypothetical protein
VSGSQKPALSGSLNFGCARVVPNFGCFFENLAVFSTLGLETQDSRPFQSGCSAWCMVQPDAAPQALTQCGHRLEATSLKHGHKPQKPATGGTGRSPQLEPQGQVVSPKSERDEEAQAAENGSSGIFAGI